MIRSAHYTLFAFAVGFVVIGALAVTVTHSRNSYAHDQKARGGAAGEECYSVLLGPCYLDCEYEFIGCVDDECGGDYADERCIYNEDTQAWEGVAPEYDDYCSCYSVCDFEIKGNCRINCQNEHRDFCPSCNENKKCGSDNAASRDRKSKYSPNVCYELEIGECYVDVEYQYLDCLDDMCGGNFVDERCVFDEVNGEWVGVEAQYDDYCNCISYCEGYRYSSYGECQLDTEIVCPSCGDDDLDDDATNDDSANDDDDTGTPVDDDDDNDDSGGACGC